MQQLSAPPAALLLGGVGASHSGAYGATYAQQHVVLSGAAVSAGGARYVCQPTLHVVLHMCMYMYMYMCMRMRMRMRMMEHGSRSHW